MLRLDIPGFGRIEIHHLVSDFTGTLSVDGRLAEGVRARLERVTALLPVHILTADTFQTARRALEGVECTLHVFEEPWLDRIKGEYVHRLGAREVLALGNGRNDRAMLAAARVGVAVCMEEGCAVEALRSADLLVPSAAAALDLVLEPRRLLAGLRS